MKISWGFVFQRKIVVSCLYFVLFCGASSFADARRNEPFGQVLGFYSKGALHGASRLGPEGPGFTHLFRERNRGWGSEGLVDLIQNTALEFARLFPDSERLQLGDVAAEQGGYISGHASHQNGLDFDAAYFRVNHEEQDPTHENGFNEKFVIRGALSRNFDVERNLRFVQLLVASGRINRIFMDEVIKRALCRRAHSDGDFEGLSETLRRIRPLENHDDHMHVRLTCPDSSPDCVKQEEIPPGSGCN